jgi:hypothetical protein
MMHLSRLASIAVLVCALLFPWQVLGQDRGSAPPPPPADAPPFFPPPSPEGGPHPMPPPPPSMPGPPMDPGRQMAAPPLKMIAPGVFEIGEVRIFKKEQKVEFPCAVNMGKGLLEYAIVGDAGKLHESLLRTRVEPYSLQIALLLLGLEGTTNPLAMQGDARKPEGSPVTLWVQWKDGDQIRKARIEEWISNRQEGAAMKPTQWIFTGSVVTAEGVFLAQVERSIVAIYHDPVALIDNPLPEGGSDKVWFVNEEKVPAPGTDVTVIVHKEAAK